MLRKFSSGLVAIALLAITAPHKAIAQYSPGDGTGHSEIKLFRHRVPPSQSAGIVINNIYYAFDNSRNMDGCVIIGGGCYKNTGLRVEYLTSDHIKITGGGEVFYGCHVDYEYGECTSQGWLRSEIQP